VKALAAWLQISGITTGALFRHITRHDTIMAAKPLTPQSVALIIKTATARLRGAEAARNVAGHSLRAGYVTEAATVGLQPYQIRDVTGHRSDVTLAKYIRPINKRKVPSLF
jgi:hypothetical protein